jgi:hypothetical protein
MTKELSLFDTLLSTGTKSSGETKVSKEGSSLFDDLLKSATTQSQTSQSSTASTTNKNIGVNTSQPSTVESGGMIQKVDGEVSEPKQQTSSTSNIVKESSLLKSDLSNFVLTDLDSTVTVSSGFEKVLDVNLSQDDSTDIITDKLVGTTDQNKAVETNTNAKQEVGKTEVLKNTQNSENNVDDNSKVSDADSKSVQSVVARTPSVLDKIQVDQKNKNVVDVDSILRNNTAPVTENKNSDLKIESQVVVDKNNIVISDKTIENNISVQNNTEQAVIETSGKNTLDGKPKQDEEVLKVDSLVADTSSDKGKVVDLFTSLTTQNNTKQSIVNVNIDEKQNVNMQEGVVKNIVVPTETNSNLKIDTQTSTLPDLKEQIKQPIEQKVQVVNSTISDNVSTISTQQQSTEDNLEIVNAAAKTVSQEGVTPEETVVKNQETIVENLGSNEVRAKVGGVETNLQKQTKDIKEQTEQSIVPKDIVVPKVLEDTNKTSQTVNQKVVQVEEVVTTDMKLDVVTDKQQANTTSINNNKQNVAVELAKINPNEAPQRVDIEIDDTLKDTQIKPEQSVSKSSSSLLDKLIEDSVKVASKESSQTVEKVEIKNGQILENAKTQDSVQKNDMMENIYKSSVSKNISLAAMQNATAAKENLKNGNSVQDIQKSADMLELNLEGIEEVKTQDTIVSDTKQRAVNIGRAFLEKNFANKDSSIEKDSQTFDIEHKQTSITDTKTTTNNIIQKAVELTVNDAEVLTIQNRIIGARQQLSSMMSDVARAMYENYKPPHTAFRISLNPANLGSIAILIRSQRADNSLSISMNMSSSATLESVVANQNELRSALQKTFNDNSSFEFDFKLDPDASGGGFQNENFGSNEQNQETKEDEKSTFVASSEIIEEIQEVQKSGTYF